MEIDITFDFRTDAGGKDPDIASPTLRSYHKRLWSRSLPNGRVFELSDAQPGAYLYHSSALGTFTLSSDAVIPTFIRWVSMRHIISRFSGGENGAFMRLVYTIGGMMVWPAHKVNGRMTINGMRGFTQAIADRMDLTLECIRRHYAGDESSPLAATLDRYGDFFALFGDFDRYVSFFLLQDLVGSDGTVRFFLPFDDFKTPSVPGDVDQYVRYRTNTIEFVEARNARILQLCFAPSPGA